MRRGFCTHSFPSLHSYGLRVLKTSNPAEKMRLTSEAFELWKRREISLGDAIRIDDIPLFPSRPEVPKLVDAKEVPSMKTAPCSPSVFILLSLAHIELNAVDCYWDTLLRAESIKNSSLELCHNFYDDLLNVIHDESRHFTLVSNRLLAVGSKYGEINAHANLWDLAVSTNTDLMARLALLPLVQEARGLDAGPRFVQKLKTERDPESARIVSQIVKEEEGHVAFGMKWFLKICLLEEKDPVNHFQKLVREFSPQKGLFPPFNLEARLRAGFKPEFFEPLAIRRN